MIEKTMSARAGRVLVAGAYVLVLVIAFVVRFTPAYQAADLEPAPDAVEYALTAVALSQGEPYVLHMNGAAYPPRYPFGFPLLLASALIAFGAQPHNALYACLAYSVALVAAVMLVSRQVFGQRVALLSGLVVALGKRFVALGQGFSPDTAAALAVLLACALLIRSPGPKSDLTGLGDLSGLGTISIPNGRRGLRWYALAGFCAGLAVAISLNYVVPACAIFAVALLLAWRQGRAVVLARALVAAAGASLWLVPLLAYQWQTFGHPLATGYGFWAPDIYGNLGQVFNLRYLLVSAVAPATSSLRYYALPLLGISVWPFYPLPFVVAIGAGVHALVQQATQIDRRKLAIPLAAASASLCAGLVYAFLDVRLLLLAFLVLAMLGAHGFWALAATRPAASRRRALLYALIAFVGLAVAWHGLYTVRDSFLWQTVARQRTWSALPLRYESALFVDRIAPANAVILTNMPLPYADYYMGRGGGRQIVPLTRSAEYASKAPGKDWVVAAERPDLIAEYLRAGRAVYITPDAQT